MASTTPSSLRSARRSPSEGNPDFGYNPAVGAIIDRLKEALQGSCLPRPLRRRGDGRRPVRDRRGDVQSGRRGGCPPCTASPGRDELIGDKTALVAPVRSQLQRTGNCGGKTGNPARTSASARSARRRSRYRSVDRWRGDRRPGGARPLPERHSHVDVHRVLLRRRGAGDPAQPGDAAGDLRSAHPRRSAFCGLSDNTPNGLDRVHRVPRLAGDELAVVEPRTRRKKPGRPAGLPASRPAAFPALPGSC